MDKLIITRWKNKILTAVISKGKVDQLTLEPDGNKTMLGNIYIGKVQKVLLGINAAFVDIAPGVSGYYSLEENKKHLFASGQTKNLRPGDEIIVQVSRDAVKTKAPVLTGHLSLAGRYCVFMGEQDGISLSSKIQNKQTRSSLRTFLEQKGVKGLIVRTNAERVSPERILEEYAELSGIYQSLKGEWHCRTCYSCLYKAPPSYIAGIRDTQEGRLGEIITDEPLFYQELSDYLSQHQKQDMDKLTFYQDSLLSLSKLYSLESAMERALAKKVWLKSGGYLVIEPTEAMVVIDVNTGKYSGKKRAEETIWNINQEAVLEIARQLRLRNLSGIIMVDFIDMEQEEARKTLLKQMEDAVLKDSVKTTVVDMTQLNLVEITRKKVRKPLYEQILEEA